MAYESYMSFMDQSKHHHAIFKRGDEHLTLPRLIYDRTLALGTLGTKKTWEFSTC